MARRKKDQRQQPPPAEDALADNPHTDDIATDVMAKAAFQWVAKDAQQAKAQRLVDIGLLMIVASKMLHHMGDERFAKHTSTVKFAGEELKAIGSRMWFEEPAHV